MKEKEILNEEDWKKINEASQDLSMKCLVERLLNTIERYRKTSVLVHTIDEVAFILR